MYVCPQSVTVYLCACLSIQCLHTQRERPKIRRKRIKTFLMFSNDALAFDVYASLMPYFARGAKQIAPISWTQAHTHTHMLPYRCDDDVEKHLLLWLFLLARFLVCACLFMNEILVFLFVWGEEETHSNRNQNLESKLISCLLIWKIHMDPCYWCAL